MHICIHTIIKYFHLCIKSVNELVSDIYRNCFLFIQLYIYDQIESFLFRIILYLYEINKLIRVPVHHFDIGSFNTSFAE